MNPALRKEIRLLLPALGMALVAATIPVWLMGAGAGVQEMGYYHRGAHGAHGAYASARIVGANFPRMCEMSLVFFGAGALLLSLASFGLEMTYGTFPSLLSQPRPRRETWSMKVGLLAPALLCVAAAAVISWWLRVHVLQSGLLESVRALKGRALIDGVNLQDLYAGFAAGQYEAIQLLPLMEYIQRILMLAVVAFAGGLWTTILFRQMVTAFWFAILVPLILFSASWPLIERLSEEENNAFVLAAFGVAACVYAALGYALARWLFLHAQDRQPKEATDAGVWSLLPAFPRPRWPVTALLVKELRLQQGSVLIAGVLLVLHLAEMLASKSYPAWISKYPGVQRVWTLWMLMPLVVGCVSFAEERRNGTLQDALCLPMRGLFQFVIKLLVVFSLGLVLGAVMPWLLERLQSTWEFQKSFRDALGLSDLLFIAAILTGIGCYASTLTNTFLQAASAVIGLVLLSSCIVLPGGLNRAFQHQFLPVHRPALIATCLFLGYGNFKQLRITGRRWSQNGVVFAGAVFALWLVATWLT
jgi:hypothetical protein